MAYQGLAEYHTHLASRGPLARRSQHAIEAGQWYDKAASIWTRWRVQHLAIPFCGESREGSPSCAGIVEAKQGQRRSRVIKVKS